MYFGGQISIIDIEYYFPHVFLSVYIKSEFGQFDV